MRSALCRAIAGSLLLGAMVPVAAQTADYEEKGRIGDAASWRSDEFMADWGLGAIGAEYAYARGLTGFGVRLGIFDSGSVLAHHEFAGRDHRSIRIADPDCTNTTNLGGCFASDGDVAAIDGYLAPPGYVWSGSGQPLDLEYGSHGTHVAGTMLANRDGDSGMHGVAFGANLTTSKLFFNTLYEYYFDQFGNFTYAQHSTGPSDAAVTSMYDQMAAQGVRAINHSWGMVGDPTTAADMDAFHDAYGEYFSVFTDGSLRTGVIQVWAAGNDSGNIAGIYSTLPRWVTEAEPYWLTVANINDTGVIDASSSICGLAMNWCLAAPGTAIASSVVGGEIEGEVVVNPDGSLSLNITAERPEYGYAYYTGTSMAAPHVTGALALLMERYPYLDNAQVRDVMLTTALDLGASGVDEIYGWGLLDLKKAIEGYGQIRVDTDVVMNQHAGGAKVWEGEAWDDWTNDIGGPGRLTKSGIGWLRLSGDNSFGGLTVSDGVLELTGANRLGDTVVDGGFALLSATGSLSNAVTVNGGELIVNGVHNGGLLTVNAGGTLTGTGTVGDTFMAGTLAPGDGMGTLTVDGDYTQAAGSVYVAEIAPPDASDRLAVTGIATLLGGTVQVVKGPGQYLLGQSYDILSAAGGVTGTFAGIDGSLVSPFLAFGFTYGANGVALDVARGMALAEAAQTRNQRAVATSADALGNTSPLLQTLTQLFPEQAVAAFDALSGELHPSTRTALVADSRQVREAALDRAQPPLSPTDDGEAVTAAWAQAYGSGGTLRSDGNAGQVDRNGGGVLVGVDHRFAGGWRIGALGGSGRTDLGLPSQRSSADVDSRHLGIYAGNTWGGFALSAGLSHASHQVDSERRVAFPGIDQTLVAEYDASSTQAFLEGGYRFGRNDWTLEPYAQVARVEVDSDGFSEAGGSTALEVAGGETRATVSTVGLRFDLGLSAAQQSANWLHLRAGLGWRHASGDLVSTSQAGWSGAQAFTVAGAPMADSATVLETGVAAWLTPRSLVELNYNGHYADEARDHGVNLRWSLTF